MSRDAVENILELFDKQGYVSFLLNEFNRTHDKQKWSHDNIISTLQEAFSNGFHGIHFISARFEGCIGEILNDIVGSNHYLAYRICDKHDMIVLQPNYKKLGVSPMSKLSHSYMSDKSIHALQENEKFAVFCYDKEVHTPSTDCITHIYKDA